MGVQMNHFKKPLPPKGRDARVSVPMAVPVEPERPTPPKPAMTAVADYIAENGHKEMPRATAVYHLLVGLVVLATGLYWLLWALGVVGGGTMTEMTKAERVKYCLKEAAGNPVVYGLCRIRMGGR
jgi:hypothetical protein